MFYFRLTGTDQSPHLRTLSLAQSLNGLVCPILAACDRHIRELVRGESLFARRREAVRRVKLFHSLHSVGRPVKLLHIVGTLFTR